MKKNIVVCCGGMDQVRIDKCAVINGDDQYIILHKNQHDQRSYIDFCPWCGKELPFSCEEVKQ